MNFLKTGLILTFFAAFVFACSQTENSGNAVAVGNQTAANLPISNASAQPSTAGDELASARKIYTETCVRCHKADGTGGVTDIEGRKIKAPNFTSEKQKGEPDSEYIEVIENGETHDGMPAFKGKIGDDDIKNLVKYIRREFQGK
jgi:mono/diheme cytochrome c family protein